MLKTTKTIYKQINCKKIERFPKVSGNTSRTPLAHIKPMFTFYFNFNPHSHRQNTGKH